MIVSGSDNRRPSAEFCGAVEVSPDDAALLLLPQPVNNNAVIVALIIKIAAFLIHLLFKISSPLL